MAKLRVHNITMSLDGYMAGPDQTVDSPMGTGTQRLHSWVFDTKFGRAMMGQDGGTEGLDNDYLERGDNGIGATIMGRNMFGPIRGDWDDSGWQGWWGDTPPYGHPVFVLTHYPRDPLPMNGGTTFNFVDAGIHSALEQAFEAADGADVRLGGGASAIRQYLAAGLVDELHLVIAPVVIGGGERIFDGLDSGWPAGFEVAEFVPSETVTHAVLRKL